MKKVEELHPHVEEAETSDNADGGAEEKAVIDIEPKD